MVLAKVKRSCSEDVAKEIAFADKLEQTLVENVLRKDKVKNNHEAYLLDRIAVLERQQSEAEQAVRYNSILASLYRTLQLLKLRLKGGYNAVLEERVLLEQFKIDVRRLIEMQKKVYGASENFHILRQTLHLSELLNCQLSSDLNSHCCHRLKNELSMTTDDTCKAACRLMFDHEMKYRAQAKPNSPRLAPLQSARHRNSSADRS